MVLSEYINVGMTDVILLGEPRNLFNLKIKIR
jgi:hypothetical protein